VRGSERQQNDIALPQAAETVEQQLLLLFRTARAAFERLAKDVHVGLDAAAYGVLHLIDTGEATTVTTLATRMLVGKPTVSRQVSALEKLGLLSRELGTSRTVQLRLTDEGQLRLGAARARRREGFRNLLSEWEVADVVALGDLLTRFNQLDW
jgi:DNA-binding MarR family transcriptional regulator